MYYRHFQTIVELKRIRNWNTVVLWIYNESKYIYIYLTTIFALEINIFRSAFGFYIQNVCQSFFSFVVLLVFFMVLRSE